jgi:transcriptional regulator with XRE-family HTH domain
MDLSNVNIEALISALDGQRMSLKMSYQAVADACGVSQATIMRILKKQTEPTMAMLQQIAHAVKYEPNHEPIVLEDYTKDAYVEYLRKSLEEEKLEQGVRLAQQEAHYNMLLAQKTRTIRTLSIILVMVSVFLVGWLIMEILIPTQGWIRREAAYHAYSGIINSTLPQIRRFFSAL